ncbi:hypothetical protein [Paenibacillus terreus]
MVGQRPENSMYRIGTASHWTQGGRIGRALSALLTWTAATVG